MTLFFPLDAANALDYLAILEVKRDAKLDVADELARVLGVLAIQLPNLQSILHSRHYHALCAANAATFKAIELAHDNRITAAAVQKANLGRYRAKQRLQRHFWPKQPLLERKTR